MIEMTHQTTRAGRSNGWIRQVIWLEKTHQMIGERPASNHYSMASVESFDGYYPSSSRAFFNQLMGLLQLFDTPPTSIWWAIV